MVTRLLSGFLFLFAATTYAKDYVLMEETVDGSVHYVANYSDVIRSLQPKDTITFKTPAGFTQYVIGPRGVLGGQRFSVIVDIGDGKALRLNKKSNVEALASFQESQIRMKRGGAPVVEVHSFGKLGGRPAYLEVDFVKHEMTLAEISDALAPTPPLTKGGSALVHQRMQLQGQLSALGLDNVKAAFLEFVDKSSGFAVLDDVHPDNLVLTKRADGSLEFKVWDTGVDQPTSTRWLSHDDLDRNRSFFDEPKMAAALNGPLSIWRDEARQKLMKSRRERFPSLADRVGSLSDWPNCSGLGAL